MEEASCSARRHDLHRPVAQEEHNFLLRKGTVCSDADFSFEHKLNGNKLEFAAKVKLRPRQVGNTGQEPSVFPHGAHHFIVKYETILCCKGRWLAMLAHANTHTHAHTQATGRHILCEVMDWKNKLQSNKCKQAG